MVFLHCGQMERPDLRSVQLLARALLGAKRTGNEARLAFASNELLELISLVGLDGVLKVAAGFPPRASSDDDLRRPGAAAA
jgi:ABC-type transporter Mla MlaB component